MEWQKEWVASNRYVSVLHIKLEELPPIQRAVKEAVNKLQNKYDKILAIHEIGEATENQQIKMCLLKEELDELNKFLHISA